MEFVKRAKAIELAVEQNADVYMCIRIQPTTMIEELQAAEYFCARTAAKPKAKGKTHATAVDHGGIVARYTADWSVAKIADDMGIAPQTVINYLKKEGIYKEKAKA